ncbi:MAG TPA: type III pantothenate kinase, partial [Candidatus Ornithospirochaeta stercorigallinarum]|nr:type III pantothenate kinase [Candidatus Ornithospirochaeta stercorigallinarum]
MLLAVDIGNTNIVIAIYDGNDFVETFRIYSDEKKTSDEYMVILETLIRESGIERGRIDSAIVSSVVPNLTRSIEKIIKRL